MSEIFLASNTVNKCIQSCLSEETFVPGSAAGNHVYTCTEIAQDHYVLAKLLPLSPPSLPHQTRPGIAKALWAQDWSYTRAACLDATGLFAQWLRALFSFLLLPSNSLSPLISSPCPGCSGSPFFLRKPGEHSRSRTQPLGEGRELHSTPT